MRSVQRAKPTPWTGARMSLHERSPLTMANCLRCNKLPASQGIPPITWAGLFARGNCGTWDAREPRISVGETSHGRQQPCPGAHPARIFLEQTLGRWRGPS